MINRARKTKKGNAETFLFLAVKDSWREREVKRRVIAKRLDRTER